MLSGQKLLWPPGDLQRRTRFHMSRHSTPTSDFGKLDIGASGSGMAVTTRAMNRRNMQQQRGGPAPPPAAQGGDESDDDDESDDSDEDDDSSEEEEEEVPQAPTRMTVVNQIMAIFDPGMLTPRELARVDPQLNCASAHTLRVIAAIAQLNGDLRPLRDAVQLGRGFWASQLASNMERRSAAIQQRLEANRRNASQGDGVPRTIDALRGLFDAVEWIRIDHFAMMENPTRQRFVTLLVEALWFLVWNDGDLYANATRPDYAGDAYQSERRLFSSFIAPRGHPLAFLEVLIRFGNPYRPLLRVCAPRIGQIQAAITAGIASVHQRDPSQDVAQMQRIDAAVKMLFRWAN